jgi:hypothetical protein
VKGKAGEGRDYYLALHHHTLLLKVLLLVVCLRHLIQLLILHDTWR